MLNFAVKIYLPIWGAFTFYGRSVMAEAPLSIIARASGRQYPVFQSLYRGFPHPHIRAGHESRLVQHRLPHKFKVFEVFVVSSIARVCQTHVMGSF